MEHKTQNTEHATWDIKRGEDSHARSAWLSQSENIPFSMFHTPFQQGFGLVEVIVGIAIFLLALTGLLTAYNVFVRVGMNTLGTIQATYLLEEGVEAVTAIRDYGWNANINNLTAGTNYYLFWDWNNGRWITTTAVSKIDNVYSRYVTFRNVYRDSNDNIAENGTIDGGTKKVTVNVSWQNGATTTTRSVATYLTNLFNN